MKMTQTEFLPTNQKPRGRAGTNHLSLISAWSGKWIAAGPYARAPRSPWAVLHWWIQKLPLPQGAQGKASPASACGKRGQNGSFRRASSTSNSDASATGTRCSLILPALTQAWKRALIPLIICFNCAVIIGLRIKALAEHIWRTSLENDLGDQAAMGRKKTPSPSRKDTASSVPTSVVQIL